MRQSLGVVCIGPEGHGCGSPAPRPVQLAAAGQLAAAAVADDAGLLAGQLSSALSGGAPFEDAALLLLMGYSMASGSAAQQGGALPWDLEANLKVSHRVQRAATRVVGEGRGRTG